MKILLSSGLLTVVIQFTTLSRYVYHISVPKPEITELICLWTPVANEKKIAEGEADCCCKPTSPLCCSCVTNTTDQECHRRNVLESKSVKSFVRMVSLHNNGFGVGL